MNDLKNDDSGQHKHLFDSGIDSLQFSSTHARPGKMTNCKHYTRGCSSKAPCCGEFFACRRCHDQATLVGASQCEDEMVAKLVEVIMCNTCGSEQEPRAFCNNCGVSFAKYFCGVCNLWEDAEKGIFHCNDCGTCRVGGRENYVHCHTCRACIFKSHFADHQCARGKLERNCAVCLEFLHTSPEQLYNPPCGHVLHKKCYVQLQTQSSSGFRCPSCSQSFSDMSVFNKMMDAQIASTPQPPTLVNMAVMISCNDCKRRSVVKHHFLGNKCGHCGGYNGHILEGPVPAELAPQLAVKLGEHGG
eukprot:m.29560 g.29560  ORF g.29560 m.29560 type:complete len:302 (-) comp8115_c0_seq2:1581-2486(-)